VAALAVFVGDFQIRQVDHLRIVGIEFDGVLRTAVADAPRRNRAHRLLNGLDDVQPAQAAGGQPIPVQFDVHPAFGAADQLDVSHAGNHSDAVPPGVVREIEQLVQRDLARQRQRHNRLGVKVKFLNDRVFHVDGQVRPDQVEFLADVAGRNVHVHVQLELEQGLADVFHTAGADVLQSVDGNHRVLDPLGDVRLQLFRRRPRIDGHDGDVRNVRLGHQLQAHLPIGVHPQLTLIRIWV